MVVIGDKFHHQRLNWKLPPGNCFVLVILFPLEQVGVILFIKCEILQVEWA